MEVSSYTEARNNLKAILDRACDDYEPTIVARKNGRAAVVISLEEYNSLKETAYLFSTPVNARRLMDSVEQANAGELLHRDLVVE